MVPLIVLIVVLAAGGGIAFLVKSKKAAAAAASDEAGIGPNEFLQSPPTSFPSSPAQTNTLETPTPVEAPAPRHAAPPLPEAARALAPATDPRVVAAHAELVLDDEEDDDDEVIVARFKAPGARSLAPSEPVKPVVTPPVYHLEVEPEPVTEPEPSRRDPSPSSSPNWSPSPPSPSPSRRAGARAGARTGRRSGAGGRAELEPVAEAEPELVAEAEPELVAEVEPEPEIEPVAEAPVLALVPDDGPVIDLLGEQAVVTPAEAVVIRPVRDEVAPTGDADDEAWQDVVLQPEPDAVDHVLQALINRARFKQVEVEAVATELVERADLQGQEVSEVLAELVGRADDTTLDAARTSELTLFNDEVPSRPGQLTDFARLAPAEKKRIIVRVLCLLVARSEDQQLPPRGEGETAEPRSWPLARAVWPLAAAEDDAEAQLPSRRLAKSG